MLHTPTRPSSTVQTSRRWRLWAREKLAGELLHIIRCRRDRFSYPLVAGLYQAERRIGRSPCRRDRRRFGCGETKNKNETVRRGTGVPYHPAVKISSASPPGKLRDGTGGLGDKKRAEQENFRRQRAEKREGQV